MRRSIGFILLFLAATTLSAATTNNDASCDASALPAATLLLPYFDASVTPDSCPIEFCPTGAALPASSHVSAADTAIFPPNPGGDPGGWMYMNLHYGRNTEPNEVPSQNWVVVSMAAHGRFSGDFDAPALGNGCSPTAGLTGELGEPPAIGSAPNGGE